MSELLRTSEAAVMLVAAWLLVRLARFGRWQRLVTLEPAAGIPEGLDTVRSDQVRIAIDRAERRLLRRKLKCLPRAIAAQWMLRRRGVATRLVIGAASGAQTTTRIRLHAWLEQGNSLVIGEREAADFVPFHLP